MRTQIKYTMSGLLTTGLLFGITACDRASEDALETEKASIETAQKASGERAYFEDLLTASFGNPVEASAEPVDFAAAFVDLPEGTSLQTGDVSLDASTGATRVEDFAIVYNLNGTDVGVMADEALFFGFDPNAIPDRIKGENTTASVKVADRIELRNVKSVGMEAVSELFLEEYSEALDEFTPLDEDVITEVTALDIFSYNFEMETLLLDGFTLEPFLFAEVEQEPVDSDASEFEVIIREGEVEDREGLQMLGAFARAFSYDAFVYKGTEISYSMRQDEIEMAFQMSIDLAGSRDYRRGDLGFSGSWDGRFDGSFPIPDESSDEFAMTAIPMTGEIKYSAVSDMKLARAFEALADWKMPEAEEADFMSLGVWEITDYTLDMAEKRFSKPSALRSTQISTGCCRPGSVSISQTLAMMSVICLRS